MIFDNNESFTSEECTKQIEYPLEQMKKLDSKISEFRRILHSIPCWESPAPEDMELVNALSNKIEHLSDCADNYERQVDYWQTQRYFALIREKKN